MAKGRIRAFFNTRVGLAVLIAIAIVVTAGSFLVGEYLTATVAALLFGLGIPVWMGQKSIKWLAVVGVAILAVSPAISTAFEVPVVLAPTAAASSSNYILQNATVSPYFGGPGTNFTWTVRVDFSRIPSGNESWNMTLYLSTCPGATGRSDPNCSSGYPFTSYTQSVVNQTGNLPITFSEAISSSNIWDWQMSLFYTNNSGRNGTYVFLVGDPTYNGIAGPVVANGWGGVYGLIVGAIYSDYLIVGIVFFIGLLIYAVFKQRRMRREQAASRAAPSSGTAGAESPPAGTGASSAPLASGSTARPAATQELACPNCGAVVYPKETFCWKCGTSLSAPSNATTGRSNPPS
ncbi:MAG: hypothetical protein LVQ64_00340 [Thermoplasmatales archaeon]|nr:hypothetical protein [Thermoplasmatales archaeon]